MGLVRNRPGQHLAGESRRESALSVSLPAWHVPVQTRRFVFQGVLIFSFFVLNAKSKHVLAHRLSSQTLKSFISRESTRHSSGNSVTIGRSPTVGESRQ